MLTNEEINSIKAQLLEQVRNFPEDKRIQAEQQISAMSGEDLEVFLQQNNIDYKKQGNQCVFCSIAEGKIPSSKIGENEEAIAVLEINPISKGHVMIIPKKHSEDKSNIGERVMVLAEEIGKKIQKKFKPKKVEVFSDELFGHAIVNVIPIYENETPQSERKKASKEELESLQKELEEKPKKKVVKKSKPKTINPEKEKIIIPRRIP